MGIVCFWWRRSGSHDHLPAVGTHPNLPTVHRKVGILLSQNRSFRSSFPPKEKQTTPQRVLSVFGGDGEDRTLDLTDANRTLSQLSYAPIKHRIICAFLFYSLQYFLSSVLKRIAEKIFSFSIFSLPCRSAMVLATFKILS